MIAFARFSVDRTLPPSDSALPSTAHPLPDDTEALGDEIARLAAHLHAATYRLLVLIRAFDEREGWAGGFRSCAHWLSWRTGIGPGPAREKVRVARALGELPRISAAMARGELSYSKARALTRVATPDNEADLLELANHGTAAHVEKLVRAWRRVDRLEEAEAEVEREAHRRRSLTLYPDEDGTWVIRGRLDAEVGAVLEKALEWASEALYRRDGREADPAEAAEAGGDGPPSWGQRRADAIGLLAERAMATAAGEAEDGEDAAAPVSRADRFQVVLHVDARKPAGAHPAESVAVEPAVLADSGVGVSAETSRRLSCDASVVRMVGEGAAGGPLDVGRRRRTVPAALRRALDRRDGGCRFPGCGGRYTDAHHIHHWADGGETRLDNLVLLCRRHHRAIHEGGWRVEQDPADPAGFRFYRPDGRRLPEVPEPPRLPADPWAGLVVEHRALGIDPGPWSATPLWNGESLDVGLALDMLRIPLMSPGDGRFRGNVAAGPE